MVRGTDAGQRSRTKLPVFQGRLFLLIFYAERSLSWSFSTRLNKETKGTMWTLGRSSGYSAYSFFKTGGKTPDSGNCGSQGSGGEKSSWMPSRVFAERAVFKISWASGRNNMPSLVRVTLLLVRTNNFTSSSSSRVWIWWLTAGWVIFRTRDALEKFRCSARPENILIVRYS